MAAFSKKGYECWDLGAPPQEQADACLYRGVDTVTVILSVYRSRLRLRFGTVPYNILQIRPPSLDCCRWRNYVIPCRTRTSRPELAVSATMDEATASASVPTMEHGWLATGKMARMSCVWVSMATPTLGNLHGHARMLLGMSMPLPCPTPEKHEIKA
jgi:hypothetical protein